MSLPQSVLKHIQKQCLIKKGQTIIVGVSGGSDSIALINILSTIKHELGIKLVVAHFDHKLRASSHLDKTFVERQAHALALPFITEEWKNPVKKTDKGSLEEAARKARLKFFKLINKKYKSSIICLAHTKDDVTETVLMRIIRGSGLKGLQAIKSIRSINGLKLVRPLLPYSKKELNTYLKKNNIKFRQDPTNKSNDFQRNKVRNKLLPILNKEYNPNINNALVQLSESAAEDYDFINLQCEKALKRVASPIKSKNQVTINLLKIKREHTAIVKQIFLMSIEKLKGNTNQITNKHLNQLLDLLNNKPQNSIVDLPKQIKAKKTAQLLTFRIKP